MSESKVADTFIVSSLAANPCLLTAHKDLAPENSPLPVVIFSQQSATDRITGNSYRVWSEMVYLVKVAGMSPSSIDAMVDKIDTALDKQQNVTVGTSGLVLSCVRDGPYNMTDKTSSGTIYYRGAYYRIRAKVD